MVIDRFIMSVSSEQGRHESGQRILRRQHRFVSDLGDQFTYLNV